MKGLALVLAMWCGSMLGAVPNWHLMFCLPYDNDLNQHRAYVINEIGNAVISSKVAVTLLVDSPNGAIRFLHFRHDGSMEVVDCEENHFTNGKALEEFLSWSAKRIPKAKKRAFMMLGHGGGQNRMALEMQPDSAWMSTSRFGEILGSHCEKNGPLDAFLFQQCSKATLSEYVELAHCSEWMSASPLPIGAPNYYYHEVITSICAGGLRTPRALLQACITKDRPSMSEVWSIVQSEKLMSWISYLEKGITKHGLANVECSTLPRVIYGSSHMWDLTTWIKEVTAYWPAEERQIAQQKYRQAVHVVIRSGTPSPQKHLCGVMVCAPEEQASQEMRMATLCPVLWAVLPKL